MQPFGTLRHIISRKYNEKAMEMGELDNKRPLMVNPNLNTGELVVSNRSKTDKYSWFLTDVKGNIYLSGREKAKDVVIDINDIEAGRYSFRAQGEIFEFNIGIAS